MKIKLLKRIISDIYHRGVYDGIDITKGTHDRFLGDVESRRNWEQNILESNYQRIKKAI